jgi:hypothetical protein
MDTLESLKKKENGTGREKQVVMERRYYYNPNQYLTFTDFVSANASTSNGVKFTPGTINAPAAAQTTISSICITTR